MVATFVFLPPLNGFGIGLVAVVLVTVFGVPRLG